MSLTPSTDSSAAEINLSSEEKATAEQLREELRPQTAPLPAPLRIKISDKEVLTDDARKATKSGVLKIDSK